MIKETIEKRESNTKKIWREIHAFSGSKGATSDCALAHLNTPLPTPLYLYHKVTLNTLTNKNQINEFEVHNLLG